MAERSMAVVLKTTEPETVPGVRIPLSPPFDSPSVLPGGTAEGSLSTANHTQGECPERAERVEGQPNRSRSERPHHPKFESTRGEIREGPLKASSPVPARWARLPATGPQIADGISPQVPTNRRQPLPNAHRRARPRQSKTEQKLLAAPQARFRAAARHGVRRATDDWQAPRSPPVPASRRSRHAGERRAKTERNQTVPSSFLTSAASTTTLSLAPLRAMSRARGFARLISEPGPRTSRSPRQPAGAPLGLRLGMERRRPHPN